MSGSEPTHSDEKSKPKFTCFKVSAEFIQKRHATNGPDDYRLAHGNVARLRQCAAVNNAWILVRTSDADLSNFNTRLIHGRHRNTGRWLP